MGDTNAPLTGPDLTQGVELAALKEATPFLGHAGGEAVMIVRQGEEIFAVGATCTHYSGPLAEGLVVGEQIRCPWHHACFSLRTGDVLAAPALNPIARWSTEIREGRVYVGAKQEPGDPLTARSRTQSDVRSVVIIGGGASGTAAAENLRREGFEGDITIIDEDADAPYDRPNLSKDYLAGNAPEEWLPLRPADFEKAHRITRVVAAAQSIDAAGRFVRLQNGKDVAYDALVIATGATPIRPPIPGAELPHVHVLRTLADCRRLIEAAKNAKHIAIAGASFIGMETAAALRARQIDVTVIAPEEVPFAKVLGPALGAAAKKMHEENGVVFKLGRTVQTIAEGAVTLDDGSEVAADVVLLGIGVRPRIDLAQAAGLEVDRGIVVDEHLRTSDERIFAVGDVARFPYADGHSVRIEHWVVAQRQGAAVARNILGTGEAYKDVPFFWTQQFDMTINYVGHAEAWTELRMAGSPAARDCAISFMNGDDLVAFATIGRDRESLEVEEKLEK